MRPVLLLFALFLVPHGAAFADGKCETLETNLYEATSAMDKAARAYKPGEPAVIAAGARAQDGDPDHGPDFDDADAMCAAMTRYLEANVAYLRTAVNKLTIAKAMKENCTGEFSKTADNEAFMTNAYLKERSDALEGLKSLSAWCQARAK